MTTRMKMERINYYIHYFALMEQTEDFAFFQYQIVSKNNMNYRYKIVSNIQWLVQNANIVVKTTPESHYYVPYNE